MVCVLLDVRITQRIFSFKISPKIPPHTQVLFKVRLGILNTFFPLLRVKKTFYSGKKISKQFFMVTVHRTRVKFA